MSESVKDEIKRFESVVAARKSVGQLLDLFDLLKKSTKFSDRVKPLCYGVLITACVTRIPDSHLGNLMELISQHNAARLVRHAYLDEDADSILRPLVARLVRATSHDGEACYKAFIWFENAGVTPDLCHSLGLAIEGGMTESEMDPVCDLIHPFYYAGTSLMPAPKKEACPA